MAERDLSRNQARVLRADRKVDRRQGILPEVDPRQRQLETFADMRSARRGSGGAEGILRSLGLLEESLGRAQGVAQKQHELDEQENFENALMDHMTGTTSEERMGRSEAYRRGIGMAQTETRWFAHKAQKDTEFQAFLEQQTEPTLEGRLKEAAAWIEDNYFGTFVKDPETGEVIDMGHRDGYLLALGQIQKARPQLLAAAGARVTERFEGESVTLFQETVRSRIMAGEQVDMAELIGRVPPTVPQDKVTSAYLNTVISVKEELARAGRHQEAVALIDQALGLAEASLPEEERQAVIAAAISETNPDAAMVDTPAQAPNSPPFNMTAYLGRNRSAESSGNDAVANDKSSAVGRYQFLGDTWLQFYRKTFGDTGESPDAILRKRLDGDVQDKVMATFTQHNIDILESRGVAVNDATVYLMHFLGEGDGIKVLTASADTNIGELVGRGARRANAAVFANVRNAGQLIKWAEQKMGVEAGATVLAGDPNYTANGLPRSVRERSFDPSVQLIPELQGRFAATAEQRALLLEHRDAAVRKWDAYEAEETRRVSDETTGGFALRLVGMGPPLTEADIRKAHKAGEIDDATAAKWFENLTAHARGEEAYQRSQEAYRDEQERKRTERAARGVIGSAVMKHFAEGGDPRKIIPSVMADLRLIPDDMTRAEVVLQVTRLAEGLESANLATPEVQSFRRNVSRMEEGLGSKLPASSRFIYIDPQGNEQRVTRAEAEALAKAQLGRLSLDAMEAAARGEALNWATTQTEMQGWLQRSFRVPSQSSTDRAAAGFAN